jgi:hypothetical protein
VKINMKKQQIKAGVTSLLVGVLAPVALLVPSVSAAERFWDGGSFSSYSNSFNTPANWTGGVVPTTGDTAVFTTDSKYSYDSATVRDIDNDVSSLSLARLVFDGEVSLSSTSFSITGNEITLTSAIDAIMEGTAGDHQVLTDITLGADVTFKTTGSNTLQVGDTGKTLNLGANDLTLDASGGTITLAGEIDGSGKLILSGSKSVNMLAKGATGYTGSVEVTSGVFSVTSETEGNILVNGGTLKGSSDLLGNVTMSSGAIAPGNSPGCLGTADLTFTSGNYDVEIAGTDPCTGYDQTAVIGAVNLGSDTTLNVSLLSGYAPADNTAFALILNDAADAVVGTFKGLADGAKFTVAGYTYQINYNAGDGNDVLLLVTGTPTAPDTGVGSALTSPLMALGATIAALTVIGGIKFAEKRRK